MTLETAVLLLLCAAAGIAACGILLRGGKTLRTVLIALLSLLALAPAAYIALTLLFVDAVQSQPPAPYGRIPYIKRGITNYNGDPSFCAFSLYMDAMRCIRRFISFRTCTGSRHSHLSPKLRSIS